MIHASASGTSCESSERVGLPRETLYVKIKGVTYSTPVDKVRSPVPTAPCNLPTSSLARQCSQAHHPPSSLTLSTLMNAKGKYLGLFDVKRH